jgi:hypothetical protein
MEKPLVIEITNAPENVKTIFRRFAALFTDPEYKADRDGLLAGTHALAVDGATGAPYVLELTRRGVENVRAMIAESHRN